MFGGILNAAKTSLSSINTKLFVSAAKPATSIAFVTSKTNDRSNLPMIRKAFGLTHEERSTAVNYPLPSHPLSSTDKFNLILHEIASSRMYGKPMKYFPVVSNSSIDDSLLKIMFDNKLKIMVDNKRDEGYESEIEKEHTPKEPSPNLQNSI